MCCAGRYSEAFEYFHYFINESNLKPLFENAGKASDYAPARRWAVFGRGDFAIGGEQIGAITTSSGTMNGTDTFSVEF
ncbi:hypothetical protein F2Q69_00002303 [Brassica cretica]|uniref:Uncharacterized protein n=1 Tax=Brassica cretica TaxID=69181 RepID=A0A8S9PAT6_BRACR|nr:hypothetical protein F2Q69_00002303 [Brassica cretica]